MKIFKKNYNYFFKKIKKITSKLFQNFISIYGWKQPNR